MKKKIIKILLPILVFTTILFSIYLIKNSEKKLFMIENERIDSKTFYQYKNFFIIINSIDSILDCSIAKEIIKNKIFYLIAKDENIDLSRKNIEFNYNIHLSEIPLNIKDRLKDFNEKQIYEFFIKPFVTENLLIEKISYDTIIQKQMYEHVKKISNEWDGKSFNNNFLNPFTEYIERRIEKREKNDVIYKKVSGDDKFYYIFSSNKDIIYGYRISKIPFVEYVKTKYEKKFKLKFFDEKLKRSFILTNKNNFLSILLQIK